jgi:hypothetical protein
MQNLAKKLKIIVIPCRENEFRPRFLASDFLFYYLAVVLILKILVLPLFTYLPRTDFFAGITKSSLISLLNQDRIEQGLAPLKENPLLDKAAFLKAKDMLTKDYFSHYSPDGKSPWYWIKAANYRFRRAGENLGIGFLDSEEIYEAWKNSPSHRRNLFDPSYKEIGIAVLNGDFKGNEATVVVQLFGSPETERSPKSFVLAKKEDVTSKKKLAAEKRVAEPKLKKAQEGQESALSVSDSSSPEILSSKTAKGFPEAKEPLSFNLAKSLTFNYPYLLQSLVFYSLLVIILILMITVFVNFEVQHFDLIFRALIFILAFLNLLFLDKEMILQVIPHALNIV